MEKPPFEIMEHTADVGLIARGDDLSELFCNAARGMFSLVCDTSSVRANESVPIEVREENLDYLFFAWLDELLFLTSAKRFVFCDFKADVRNGVARGTAIGEHMDPSRHDLHLEIKAVTYHELKVARRGGLWTATVIFDV